MAKIHASLPLGIGKEDVMEINLPNELIAWCLNKVLEDQYTDGKSAGGWSKRYPEYGKFIFDDDDMYESLTVSGGIAEALVQYNKKFSNDRLTKRILSSLLLLKDHLKQRYDAKEGRFGLLTGRAKDGSLGIRVSMRHTAWSLIALRHLQDMGVRDHETDEMLNNAGGYIQKKLDSLNPDDEYALTYAVLHKILTTSGLADFVISPKEQEQGTLMRIERILVDKFVPEYGSWDRDDLIKHPKVRIDNAFSVLVPIQISSCIDKKCAENLKTALHRMCEKSLITLDDETMALPFYKDGDPDIGTTIDLIWCIIKNQDVFIPPKDVVKKMINYIVDPSNWEDNLKFAYPWNLSSALLLATKSQ